MTKIADEVDPITLEVIGADVTYVVRELRSLVLRMAYSPILTETHDFFCGVTDHNGEITAINVDVPFHMFACRDVVRSVRQTYGDDVNPGDQFFTNDCWQVGAHLNDAILVEPVFVEDRLRMWVACGVHYGDIGGTVPGSASGECTEIFHEGLRVPLVRVRSKGVRNDEFLTMLLANTRQPFEARGVFAAQSNSTARAQLRAQDLYQRYGADVIDRVMEATLENSARVAGEGIGKLAEGDYFYEDYLENGGVNHADPVYVRCKMTVANGRLKFNFSGSSPQVSGVANCGLTNTWAGVFNVVDTYLAPGRVSDFGAARRIDVVAPEGTVVNSRFPVPVNGFANVLFGPVEGCVRGCLSQAMHDVDAFITGTANQVNAAGSEGAHREDAYWIVFEFPAGGWGATSENDGNDHCYQWHQGDIPTVWPLERIERMNPIRVHLSEPYIDSGGPGYYRGGLGMRRAWEVTAPGTFSVLGTDGIFPRPGMRGGYAGALNWIGAVRDSEPVEVSNIPLKAGAFPLRAGDMVAYLAAGGGGYGDPLKRPAEWVLDDVKQRYVSVEGAREDYGVVITNGAIDATATERLREQKRNARVFVDIATCRDDEYDSASRRIIRLDPETAKKLEVGDEDLVEYVTEKSAHVRAWVRIDDKLPPGSSPLGPYGRSMLGLDAGTRIQLRTPWTYSMRNQQAMKQLTPPSGRLFAEQKS